MKTKLTTITAAALICITPTLYANKINKPLKKANVKKPHRTALVGDPAEFGALADAFRAHQKLTAGGGAYYPKDEQKLRGEHASLYRAIQRAVTEDRLSEENARNAITQLLTVGKEHLKAGDAASTESTSAQLTAIRKEVKMNSADKVPANILTPKVNRIQFHLEEALHFGSASDKLSSGQVKSLRRKMDSLEAKEDKMKKGGSISDSDREKLIEESREIWRDALGDFL